MFPLMTTFPRINPSCPAPEFGVTRMPWDTSLRAVVRATTQFSIFQCVPEQEIPSRPILKTLQPEIFQLSPLPWIAAAAARKLPISKPKSSMLQLFVPEVLMRFARGVAANLINTSGTNNWSIEDLG